MLNVKLDKLSKKTSETYSNVASMQGVISLSFIANRF